MPNDARYASTEGGYRFGRQIYVFRRPKSQDISHFVRDSEASFYFYYGLYLLFRATSSTICNIRRILFSGRLLTIANYGRNHFVAGVNGIHAKRPQDLTNGGIRVCDVVCLSQTRVRARCFFAFVRIKRICVCLAIGASNARWDLIRCVCAINHNRSSCAAVKARAIRFDRWLIRYVLTFIVSSRYEVLTANASGNIGLIGGCSAEDFLFNLLGRITSAKDACTSGRFRGIEAYRQRRECVDFANRDFNRWYFANPQETCRWYSLEGFASRIYVFLEFFRRLRGFFCFLFNFHRTNCVFRYGLSHPSFFRGLNF